MLLQWLSDQIDLGASGAIALPAAMKSPANRTGCRAAQRLHPNVLASALANKLARIAWTVLAQERSYETRLTEAAA